MKINFLSKLLLLFALITILLPNRAEAQTLYKVIGPPYMLNAGGFPQFVSGLSEETSG